MMKRAAIGEAWGAGSRSRTACVYVEGFHGTAFIGVAENHTKEEKKRK